MDEDDVPTSLGSAIGGAVEPRTVFGRLVDPADQLYSAGAGDDTADQDDLDTWWAFMAGRQKG